MNKKRKNKRPLQPNFTLNGAINWLNSDEVKSLRREAVAELRDMGSCRIRVPAKIITQSDEFNEAMKDEFKHEPTIWDCSAYDKYGNYDPEATRKLIKKTSQEKPYEFNFSQLLNIKLNR